MDDPPARLTRDGYILEIEDHFDGPALDDRLWLPHYLPHWSSRERTATRYAFRDGHLILRIDRDQPPWAPEFDGHTKVSSLQTGLFAGPVGSGVGQLQFRDGLAVREAQSPAALFTPTYGLFEARARVIDDPANMAALWMIGLEDERARSGEICIFEIFGRDVGARTTRVGMGVHPFADPALRDDFTAVEVPIDAREFHTYAAEWTPARVAFYVDDDLIKVVRQSPAYPMQFMLGIYEFADGPGPPSPPKRYPKEFAIDWFRAWRRPA